MTKVAAVPRHYLMTMNDTETRNLIVDLRALFREFEVSETTEGILMELEDKYEGELGSPPGAPIEEAAA